MTDFNLIQMKNLLDKNNVSVVYLQVVGDYWIKQQEFINDFKQVPLENSVVIHVCFEGISLSHSLVAPAVEKIIEETGRDTDSVYIYSPNFILTDTKWENIFWRTVTVTDEIPRSKLYWVDNLPPIENDFKTWALFVGRRTTPRLKALYDIWHDPVLRERCLVSVMIKPDHTSVLIFDDPDKIYDHLDQWMPVPIENKIQKTLQHNDFRKFCRNLPFGSIDGFSAHDQYLSNNIDNRNPALPLSLINLSGNYLFEIVFETMTLGVTFTPSEKTIRPIIAQKPFVAYAPKNFLSNLRSLGFQTFGELWDESYDLLEGIDRYQAMIQIIKQISALNRETQLNMHTKIQDICVANKKLLYYYISADKTKS